jgi:hypothetical protein
MPSEKNRVLSVPTLQRYGRSTLFDGTAFYDGSGLNNCPGELTSSSGPKCPSSGTTDGGNVSWLSYVAWQSKCIHVVVIPSMCSVRTSTSLKSIGPTSIHFMMLLSAAAYQNGLTVTRKINADFSF